MVSFGGDESPSAEVLRVIFQSSSEPKPMTDQTGVAPETAEKTETETNSSIISIGDIAEAVGLGDKFFESANETETEDQVSLDESVEAEEESEELPEEEETSEEAEEEQQVEESLSAELSETPTEDSSGVKKRIGKLIEARNKAEEEVELLKAKLEEKESKPDFIPDPKGMDRFQKVTTFKELQEREQEAEHLREWLLANPDGGEYTDASGTDHEVDYDSAKRLMVETDRDLRKNIPLAVQRLQQREQNRKVAYETFDWMKDQSSIEMQEVQNVLRTNKFIKEYYESDPNSVLTIAYAIEGLKAVNARKAKKPSVPKVAPKVPSAPQRAKRSLGAKNTPSKKSLLQQARSGSVEDASSYIESLL